jgi:hypothetical protein
MLKVAVLSLIFISFYWLNYYSPLNRIQSLNSRLNTNLHGQLDYTPRGYIYCIWIPGGLNNQLEQLWFLNILARRTKRGLVETKLKLVDNLLSSRVNISELINRDKYLSNLPTIQIEDFATHCGPYIRKIDLPDRDWMLEDEINYLVDELNDIPQHFCIVLNQFPTYKFFARPGFTNWVDEFKTGLLPHFEFSELIKDQAADFLKTHNMEDGNFLSVQFRRGDFKDHCKVLFNLKYDNWSFGHLLTNSSVTELDNWDEFNDHCFPTTQQFIAKLNQIISGLPKTLKKVLFLTNAGLPELNIIQKELNSQNLEFVRFTPNEKLIPQEIEWCETHSLAVEMELAKLGTYLLGNKHSSIFSNLVGLKLNQQNFSLNNTIII